MSDSEQRLGDPMDLPEEKTPSLEMECEKIPERRQGDSGLGVPDFEPEDSRTLTPEEIETHRQEVEEQLRVKAELMLAEIEAEEGWRLPAPLRRFLAMVLVVVAAVLGLFLVVETVQFFAYIKTLPVWGQWLASGCLVLFGGVLVVVLLWILGQLVRLRRSPQIHLKAMKVLAERRKMQCMAAEHQSEARKTLEAYLKDHTAVGRGRKQFVAMGMTELELNQLDGAKNRLLDRSRTETDEEWLDEFSRSFQSILDAVARRRIKQYARRVGVGTAASPVAMVDRMIVLYSCIAMVKDLFKLYHLRPAFGQTVVILSRAVVLTYLSGMVEEATETAVDVSADALEDFVGEGAGVLTGTVGRAVGAKASEAALNGFLIWRLGKRSMTLLRPVR